MCVYVFMVSKQRSCTFTAAFPFMAMHRDSFNFIILGLQKFELQKSTKIWHIYIYCNIKIFENETSKTSKYFNTLCIYNMFTLQLISHHLIMKINIQTTSCHCNYSLNQEGCSYFSETTRADAPQYESVEAT